MTIYGPASRAERMRGDRCVLVNAASKYHAESYPKGSRGHRINFNEQSICCL